MDCRDYIAEDLWSRFEFFNYGHAVEIIHEAYPEEWHEIEEALRNLKIPLSAVKAPGGSESEIPRLLSAYLRPRGWEEIRITGDLIITATVRDSEIAPRVTTLKGWIDGHNIDYVKARVAVDMEWNSKDQTFDRDLLAMRTYFDCGLIEAGVIITRAENLNEIFTVHGVKKKYGASTTWMGKLLPRLDSRRNGGCPILAIGIQKGCVILGE